ILGIPGLALALCAALFLREPRTKSRQERARSIASPSKSVSFFETLLTLWRIRSFRYLLSCFSIVSFFSYGIGQWQPTFFVRSFGMQTGELGTWFAIVFGGCGIIGTLLGGELAARFAPLNEKAQMIAMAIAY